MSKNRTIDDLLFRQIRDGDERSFELLFKKYYAGLSSYAMAFVKCDDLARELAHETFIKIWKRRDSINIKSSFKSYIYRSLHNNCINFLKKSRQLSNLNETAKAEILKQHEINMQCFDQENFDRLLSDDFDNVFTRGLNALPDQCKEIFILCRDDKLSYQEVASRLGISVNTVKTQMKRALAKLREQFSLKKNR
ncbi:MAG: RNA polymerase sigma factor [Bacteroidales bacterium]